MARLDLSKVTAALERIPEQFEGMVAQVGFPKGANYEDGTPVAYVAAIQEWGAPEVSIPARPFFRPAIEANKDKYVQIMRHGVKMVQDGGAEAFDVLDAVGRAAVADIQESIAEVTSPPLKPVSVLLRKWKKDGRKITGKVVGEAYAQIEAGVDPGDDDKPLNATGYMIVSVSQAVNKEGEEFEK